MSKNNKDDRKPVDLKNKEVPLWTDKVSSICDFFMVIIAIVGAYLILQELDNLQEQNTYLNKTLLQSYRPLGILQPKEGDNYPLQLHFSPTSSNKKISFYYQRDFFNKGQGILIFSGFIYYITDKEINFRREFMNNKISKVEADGFFSYTRNYPIVQGDKSEYPITLKFENIDIKSKYFLYTLVFYKDQDQNLYDTQYLTVLPFIEPIKTGNMFIGRFNNTSHGSLHQNFYSYNSDERKKLIEQCKKSNLYIWEYLSDDHQ